MARPRNPTALHKLRGNPGKRKLPENEPEPAPAKGSTRPPYWLDAKGANLYVRLEAMLVAMRVLTEADRFALVAVCQAYAEWRDAMADVKAHGYTYASVTPTGGTIRRPNPAVGHMHDAWRRYMAGLSQFGLTPASRARTTALPAETKDPFAEFDDGAKVTAG